MNIILDVICCLQLTTFVWLKITYKSQLVSRVIRNFSNSINNWMCSLQFNDNVVLMLISILLRIQNDFDKTNHEQNSNHNPVYKVYTSKTFKLFCIYKFLEKSIPVAFFEIFPKHNTINSLIHFPFPLCTRYHSYSYVHK